MPIAYTITAALSFQKIVALVDPASSWGGGAGGGLGRWIVIFMAVNLCVVQVRSFHSLSSVSMIGTLASVFYALVAFIGSVVHGRGGGAGAEAVSYKFGTVSSHGSTELQTFNAANAIATIAFAYGGKRREWEFAEGDGGGGWGGGGGGGDDGEKERLTFRNLKKKKKKQDTTSPRRSRPPSPSRPPPPGP